MTEAELLLRLALEAPCSVCKAPAREACAAIDGREAKTLPDGGIVHWPRLPVEAHHPPLREPKSRKSAPCSQAHPTKRAFKNKPQAERAVQRIRKHGARNEEKGKPSRPYLCTSCNRWFLTSRPA